MKSEVKHQNYEGDLQQHLQKARMFTHNSLLIPPLNNVTQVIVKNKLDAHEEAKSNAEDESTMGFALQSKPQSPKFLTSKNSLN